MPTDPAPLDRSSAAVLRAATQVLVLAPRTSLGELAAAIGIGRTTLHRMFPSRQDLLRAVAHDALDRITEVYAEAGVRDPAPPGDAAMAAVERAVAGLLPLGPSLVFLLRTTELDDDEGLARRTGAVDEPLHATVREAQRHGDVDASVPTWWAVETLLADVYTAWEQLAHGRLAPLDAAPLVLRTWLRGVG